MTGKIKKCLIGLLILFMLVGCNNEVPKKENSTEYATQPYTLDTGDKEGNVMLKASYGTVKEVSESNVVIEGVDSKIYTGNPSGFEELHQGEFVYLEFSSYEETETGYNVEFTILTEEDRKVKVPLN